jgi:hypothetical protein
MEKDQRATPGQPVWVCIDCIKAERRDDFRRFLFEVKLPAVRAIRPEAHASVRLLEPATANPDGTWAFIWLMDPAMPGEDYDTSAMLTAFYGAEKGSEYMRQWEDFSVEEQQFYEMVQTDW